MIAYKKKDIIIHPSYGSGVIIAVRPIHDKLSSLEVEFKEAGVCKEFNSQWVEEHCKHEPYIPPVKQPRPPKPEFKDGVYLPCPELSSDVWQVSIEQSCDFTDEFKEGLAYVMQNVTPGINLVLIGTSVVVALFPEDGETDEEIEKAAREYMTKVFKGHPDFATMELKDGGLLISMLEDRLWYFMEPRSVVRNDDKQLSFITLLYGREILRGFCRNKTMYAILRGV